MSGDTVRAAGQWLVAAAIVAALASLVSPWVNVSAYFAPRSAPVETPAPTVASTRFRPETIDDCSPCPANPGLLCCSSLSLVDLGPELRARIDRVEFLEQALRGARERILLTDANLAALTARVAKLEATAARRRRRTAK